MKMHTTSNQWPIWWNQSTSVLSWVALRRPISQTNVISTKKAISFYSTAFRICRTSLSCSPTKARYLSGSQNYYLLPNHLKRRLVRWRRYLSTMWKCCSWPNAYKSTRESSKTEAVWAPSSNQPSMAHSYHPTKKLKSFCRDQSKTTTTLAMAI